MTAYRCFFRDQTGTATGWRQIQSDSDAGARELALDLMRKKPDIQNLEAWRSADLAFRLSKLQLHTDKDRSPRRSESGSVS